MVNKFIGIGRIGRDPEQRFSPSGLAVVNFSVACSEKYKTQAGEQKEDTYWARCIAFGKLAEIIAKYGSKGQQVYVEGKMQERSWDDKDGVKRYTTECIVREFKMLGSRDDNQRNQGESRPSQAKQESYQVPDDSDDLPF